MASTPAESGPDGRPIVLIRTARVGRTWLTRNHERSDGVWLKVAKKGSAEKSVRYLEFLDDALCFGWIDGLTKSYDATWYLVRFTPRRARSVWSQVNREKIERLSAAGLMEPPGLAQVAAAKADGRWEAAYAGASTATVPPDLQAALDASPSAAAAYGALSGQNRYAILYRLQTVKKAETRERNIVKYVTMLERGETLY